MFRGSGDFRLRGSEGSHIFTALQGFRGSGVQGFRGFYRVSDA